MSATMPPMTLRSPLIQTITAINVTPAGRAAIAFPLRNAVMPPVIRDSRSNVLRSRERGGAQKAPNLQQIPESRGLRISCAEGDLNPHALTGTSTSS